MLCIDLPLRPKTLLTCELHLSEDSGDPALPYHVRRPYAESSGAVAVASVTVNEDPNFEQWVTDEGGPEAVLAMIDEVRRQADDGSLRGFTDKDEFLSHLGRHGRRSA